MKKLKYCIGMLAFCGVMLLSSKTASARITYDLNGNKVDVMGSTQLTKESGEYSIIAPSLKTRAYFDKNGNLLKLINTDTNEVVIQNVPDETTSSPIIDIRKNDVVENHENEKISLPKVKNIKRKAVKAYYTSIVGYTKNDKPIRKKEKYEKALTFYWNKVKNANGYEIYRYEVAKKCWTKIKTTNKNKITLTDIHAYETIKLKIRAYKNTDNGKEFGAYSKVYSMKAKHWYAKHNSDGVSKWAAEDAFVLQNKERIKKGSKPLIWDDVAYEIACKRIQTINKYEFSHDRLGSDINEFMQKTYGVYNDEFLKRFRNCGENLVTSMGIKESMRLWKRSPLHYHNMIDDNYVTGAIAISHGYGCSVFWSHTFDQLADTSYNLSRK